MRRSGRDGALVDGVGVAAERYEAPGVQRPRFRATLGLLAASLAVATGALAVADHLIADASTYACPPDCGRPPNAVPIANLPRFVASNGAFLVDYPEAGSVYEVSTQDDGVTARLLVGDEGVLRLFGEPAGGRTAREVVQRLIAEQFPNAQIAYELPNAHVGYQVGYGVVADFLPPGVATRYARRVIVIAAVKKDLALIASAEGPFRPFTAEFGPGPPSGANLQIGMDMGRYVDSFRWKGDPPR